MSIFSTILSKIFPVGHPATQTSADTASAQAPAQATTDAPANAPVPAPAAAAPVDVEAVLTNLAQQRPETLNWRASIVDLMKLLDLDSSLAARKQLAQELHFSGDMNDSAQMNVWLHKQVMVKLAENGGKVPDDLKS